MRLTIDNYDGAGEVDCTELLCASEPLTIERKLNAPTLCKFVLVRPRASLAMPVQDARVVVTSDSGKTLFTGYVSLKPSLRYVGMASEGAVVEVLVRAVSDEYLFDRLGYTPALRTSGSALHALLQEMADGLGGAGLRLSSTTDVEIGEFDTTAGGSWSENVGRAAAMGSCLYRAMNGSLSLMPVASLQHELREDDGSLALDGLEISAGRRSANDVTLCGEIEPGAYVTEVFEGDGVTSAFELSEAYYAPTSALSATLVNDDFRSLDIDRGTWSVQDSSGQLVVRADGLIADGGTGVDGQTVLASVAQLEFGGTLIAELTGVQVRSGDGVLCGLFAGGTTIGSCLSGFVLHTSATSMELSAVVAGQTAGGKLVLVPGRVYSLRARVHAAEVQRIRAGYIAETEEGTRRYGGDLVPCGAELLLEVQDMTGGVIGPVTQLYDGSVDDLPAIGSFVPLSSVSLQASVRSASVTNTGSAWVTSRLVDGTTRARLLGAASEGADCALSPSGILHFYAGKEPATGELVSVSYRTRSRSVARNARRYGDEGAPMVTKWIGKIESPAARSSVDCENAVEAVLDLSCRGSAALKGAYTTTSLRMQADVWPGDALRIQSPSLQLEGEEVIVRSVLIESGSDNPDVWRYRIDFANDWANDVAIRIGEKLPADMTVPRVAGVELLESLSGLKAEFLAEGVIEVDAGASPPGGGGFEVRRRDGAFGSGVDSDLVLRSPVRTFQIPTSAVEERFYIRMYDAAISPRYSRFAAAIIVHLHLQQ